MTPVPFRSGSQEQFAAVRSLFRSARFTGEHLKDLGLTDSASILKWDPPPHLPASFLLLFHLFLKRGATPVAAVHSTFGEPEATTLFDLGLLRADSDECHATVRIRPYGEIFVLADFWTETPRFEADRMDDVVFIPDSNDSLHYLDFLPTGPCQRYLEACSGSGIGALLAAKNVGHAWSVDIAERSVEFARFNAQLNGTTNFTSMAGDTYSAVDGMQFDCITAHPPFVPVLRHTWLFHDGGEDGESITRRHVEGLPRVLAPGGRYYCRCMVAEREESSIEERIRQWLGEHQEEFDVAVFDLPPADPVRAVARSAIRWNLTGTDIDRMIRRFQELSITCFQFVYFFVQRHATPRPALTIRRRRTPGNGPAHADWLMQFEQLRSTEGSGFILNRKLKRGDVKLHQALSVAEDGWEMLTQRMEVIHPFPLNWEVDGLTTFLLPQMDGTRSGMELFQFLLAEGVIGQDSDPQAFAEVLGQLASGGFILVEGHEPPPPIPSQEIPW